MEIVDVEVAAVGERLKDLVKCIERDRSLFFTGRATHPDHIRVGDLLKIYGDRHQIFKVLDECDPAWKLCLSPC